MVLVDTSVWLRSLAGRRPYSTELGRLLGREEVLGHDYVHGELLVGDNGGRKALLEDYRLLHRVPTASHEEVTVFVRERKIGGRGIGWVDAHLLAAAVLARVLFWTADDALQRLAQEVGVVYEP